MSEAEAFWSGATEAAPDIRDVGDRIEALLEKLQASIDGHVWPGVEELVRLLTELYGAGLARTIELAGDPTLIDRLAGDDLVASLLLLHDLHPDDLAVRARRAVDEVAPTVRRGGADVQVVAVDPDRGVVEVAVTATASGCGSTAEGLREMVDQAVANAVPDARSVVVTLTVEQKPTVTPVTLGHKRSVAAAGP